MMAKKRILSWLVAASLALSLLPAAALAADEKPARDTVAEKTAGSISDAIYNTSTAKDSIENAEEDADALNKAVETEVGTVTVEKDEDGNVINSASKVDEEVKKATDAVTGEKDSAQAVIKEAEDQANTDIDNSVKNDNVTYTEVTSTVNDNGTITVTEEEKTAEDTGDKYVDVYVREKANEINGASDAVTTAKEAAEEALRGLDTINTTPATEEEKAAALAQAQDIADAVKEQADAAQAAADDATNAYNAAKAAYEAALEAYKAATATEESALVGKTEGELSELGGTVKDDLADADAAAKTKADNAKNIALAQLNAAQKALEAAEGIKAQAEKAQADAIAAQAYAESAQSIADAIKECLDAKESDKLSAKVELLKQLQDSIDKQLENVDTEQVSKDSNRLAWIEGVNGEQGELNIQKGLVGVENGLIRDYTEKRDNAKTNIGKKYYQGLLDAATKRRDGYQAKVDELEAERAEIRENNGANIDLYRLAVQTDVFGPSVILSDSVVAALQEEIDYRAKTAQEAAKTAKDATDKYNAALAAVKKAQDDVKNLKYDGYNVDEARRAAEQRLLDAKAALDEAEAVKDAAIELAEITIEDYNRAVDTVSEIDEIVIPPAPDADDTDTDDDGTAIADGIVPLALMPTRGELMNYLYVRAGSPAAQAPTFTDVPADHDFALAIGWAQANGIAVAYEDGTFDPDNFVVAADMTAFLTRYAAFANMEMPTLTTMAGLDDDAIVENADEILAEFFGD